MTKPFELYFENHWKHGKGAGVELSLFEFHARRIYTPEVESKEWPPLSVYKGFEVTLHICILGFGFSLSYSSAGYMTAKEEADYLKSVDLEEYEKERMKGIF